jgi:3-hydroxyisobutyrate dehydrogenase-like beta-hydroxyacid dehydrogenase
MPESPTTTAGVIGLGMMGSGIAVSLDAAGLLGAAFDVAPDVFESFPQLADRARPSAAALAADVDVVFLVVVDRAQLEDVLFSPGGVVEGAHPGLVACICSTVTADDVAELAARAAESGLTLVDVGIAGGPDAAATGNLLTTVGADDDAFARIAPCLDAISVRAIHAGPLGAGMKLKLVKNALSFMTMCAVHEALLLGEELGFSSALVKEVAADSNLVDHFFWFPMSRHSARPYGDDVDPNMLGANRHFADLARKDVAAAAAAADSVGMDHPVMDLTVAQAARYFLLPES